MNVQIVLQGADALKAGFEAFEREVRREQRQAMQRGVVLISDEARRRIHSPGGRARRGIEGRTALLGGEEVIGRIGPRRGPLGRAAIFAQRSRGPGKKGPPRVAARAIARHYGRPPQAAFLIARAIAARGTTGRPVMHASLLSRRAEIQRVFAGVLARGVAAFSAAARPRLRGGKTIGSERL